MSNKKRKMTILFDLFIGEPIFKILSFFKNRDQHVVNDKIRSILLIRPGGIGDYLLSIPAFEQIRNKYPLSKITIFVFKRNKICLEIYNNFDRSVIIDDPVELLKFILSKKDWDLVIDFDQNRKIPSILALLSKADISIGFNRNGKEKAYDFPIHYDLDKYEAQCFLDLLVPLKISKKILEKDLVLIKNSPVKKRVGIYACAMKEENRLSISRWEEIIRDIGRDNEYYFFGSKEDSSRYDRLKTLLGKEYNVVRQDGKTDLDDCMKIISTCSILVAEDGGIYHLGVCTSTPTISYWLHGKTNMDKWKAPFDKHKGFLIK